MRVHHCDNSVTMFSGDTKPCHIMGIGGGRVAVKFIDEMPSRSELVGLRVSPLLSTR